MRPLAFTAFAVFAAAALAAAPVSAQDNGRNNNGRGFTDDGHGRHGGGGQRHFGGGGGGGGQWQHHGGERRHGGAGFAAPALILGLGAAAVGAAIANGHRNNYDEDESCGGHYERVYDDWGNYRGKRFVSDC